MLFVQKIMISSNFNVYFNCLTIFVKTTRKMLGERQNLTKAMFVRIRTPYFIKSYVRARSNAIFYQTLQTRGVEASNRVGPRSGQGRARSGQGRAMVRAASERYHSQLIANICVRTCSSASFLQNTANERDERSILLNVCRFGSKLCSFQ